MFLGLGEINNHNFLADLRDSRTCKKQTVGLLHVLNIRQHKTHSTTSYVHRSNMCASDGNVLKSITGLRAEQSLKMALVSAHLSASHSHRRVVTFP